MIKAAETIQSTERWGPRFYNKKKVNQTLFRLFKFMNLLTHITIIFKTLPLNTTEQKAKF